MASSSSTVPRADRRGSAATAPTPVDPVDAAVKRCRKLVNQRALMAAGVAALPVPGLDWATDIGVLLKLLPRISMEFGLAPDQIERLAPDRRIVVYKAISTGSGMLVGRVMTRDLVLRVLKLVGVRLTTQQASKYVPLAGQAVSAALTYSALRYVCELHIRQCADVARRLALPPPGSSSGGDVIDVTARTVES